MVERHSAPEPLSRQLRDLSVRASSELAGYAPEQLLRDLYATLQDAADSVEHVERAIALAAGERP